MAMVVLVELKQRLKQPHAGGQHFSFRAQSLSFVQQRGSPLHEAVTVSGRHAIAQRNGKNGHEPAK